jgi:hypothetical protein
MGEFHEAIHRNAAAGLQLLERDRGRPVHQFAAQSSQRPLALSLRSRRKMLVRAWSRVDPTLAPAGSTAPPTPVMSLAANIEEERDEPLDPTVRRVRVIPFTVPLSSSRRIQQTFEELVDQCRVSAAACEAFLGH